MNIYKNNFLFSRENKLFFNNPEDFKNLENLNQTEKSDNLDEKFEEAKENLLSSDLGQDLLREDFFKDLKNQEEVNSLENSLESLLSVEKTGLKESFETEKTDTKKKLAENSVWGSSQETLNKLDDNLLETKKLMKKLEIKGDFKEVMKMINSLKKLDPQILNDPEKLVKNLYKYNNETQIKFAEKLNSYLEKGGNIMQLSPVLSFLQKSPVALYCLRGVSLFGGLGIWSNLLNKTSKEGLSGTVDTVLNTGKYFVPFIGNYYDYSDAYQEFKNGNFKNAGLNVFSGTAGLVLDVMSLGGITAVPSQGSKIALKGGIKGTMKVLSKQGIKKLGKESLEKLGKESLKSLSKQSVKNLQKGAKYLTKETVESFYNVLTFKGLRGLKGINNTQDVLRSQNEISKEVRENSLLKPQERLKKSEEYLGKKLTEKEQNAILKAHKIKKEGESLGSFSYMSLKEKSNILKDAGFNEKERRVLMEKGITGELNLAKTSEEYIYPEIKTDMNQRLNELFLKLKVKEISSKELPSNAKFLNEAVAYLNNSEVNLKPGFTENFYDYLKVLETKIKSKDLEYKLIPKRDLALYTFENFGVRDLTLKEVMLHNIHFLQSKGVKKNFLDLEEKSFLRKKGEILNKEDIRVLNINQGFTKLLELNPIDNNSNLHLQWQNLENKLKKMSLYNKFNTTEKKAVLWQLKEKFYQKADSKRSGKFLTELYDQVQGITKENWERAEKLGKTDLLVEKTQSKLVASKIEKKLDQVKQAYFKKNGEELDNNKLKLLKNNLFLEFKSKNSLGEIFKSDTKTEEFFSGLKKDLENFDVKKFYQESLEDYYHDPRLKDNLDYHQKIINLLDLQVLQSNLDLTPKQISFLAKYFEKVFSLAKMVKGKNYFNLRNLLELRKKELEKKFFKQK
jgi:hypothetical protein